MNNDMTSGRSIRLFLIDGSPNGIIISEIGNWSGHVISAPRSKLFELIKWEELRRTGVYFLIGSDPETGRISVYIGESDEVGKRLKGHNLSDSKHFWERTCLVTSKDHNLTKAHVRYLESRLIQIAKNENRADIVNATAPEWIRLPEADTSDMEYFINQIRLILPVLGLSFLRPRLSEITNKSTTEPLFELVSQKHRLKAEAREVSDEFFILKGSQAQSKWIGVREHGYARLHRQLLEEGKLEVQENGIAQFTEDVPFSSPSAASAVVVGRADNGRKSWRIKGSRKTYADWHTELISNPTENRS